MNTFFISSLLSLFEILAVIRSKNCSNSSESVPSSTKSLIIWKIGWFLASPPNEFKAALNSVLDRRSTFRVDNSGSFRIEEIECFFDLLNFVEWDAWSFELLELERFLYSWGSWVGHVGGGVLASSHVFINIIDILSKFNKIN